MSKLIRQKLSGTIIGIAMEVLNELKPGLDEKLYERAMVIELRRRGHDANVAQMIGYLAISGLKLALLLNFKTAKLEWKRVIQQHKKESDCPDLHA